MAVEIELAEEHTEQVRLDYSVMTVEQLKKRAKWREIKAVSKLRKAELIDVLKDHSIASMM